jgi:anti-sigma factor RsiW
MPKRLRLSDLQAYLEEALPAEEMARIEQAIRSDAELARELAHVSSRRDAGLHSLGEIWRRHRLSCVSREELGSYLLGVLPDDESDYIQFHLETIGCRWCRANLDDLQRQQSEAQEVVANRRRKYYQSSAGYLRRE